MSVCVTSLREAVSELHSCLGVEEYIRWCSFLYMSWSVGLQAKMGLGVNVAKQGDSSGVLLSRS